MGAKNLVIVESPAKAKTINKYLGSDYEVLASFGHVRDLPAKDGSVAPDNDFAMQWEVDGKSKKRIDEIAKACRSAANLYLATDPDREGEAISWHLTEELTRRKALNGLGVQRVVFNEITKSAVLAAMAEPREVNRELVEAYLARRALDYLVGFTLSPVLWRKLPGAKSAGRVQSVALRLVCEREAEIEAFRAREYWHVEATMLTPSGAPFIAKLTHLGGKKLDKFDLSNEEEASRAVATVEAGRYTIASVERKAVRRNPAPPFTTSTLQQEASRKLQFGATKTMRVAQKLYEGIALGGETVGLISYMRTDSTSLSGEALGAARRLIGQDYGDPYLPDAPRVFKTKAKNAQEAHEAIRPTDVSRRPDAVRPYLDRDQARLYELIWKRTVASQMANAVFDQTAADITDDHRGTTLRATGSVLKFDGFLKLYFEDVDDPDDDSEDGKRLPPLETGEQPGLNETRSEQHFTQPPPRYSEASLVKKMEELGIGRPSTYASILKVLQDREYVRLDQRRFIPEDRGRLVTAFLSSFYERYFEYGFTAELENELDLVSDGKIDWKTVLRRFWDAFSTIADATMNLTGQQVRDTIDRELGPHFFPPDENGSTEAARVCPSCADGRLGLNFGRFGAFIACSNYPECRYTRNLDEAANDDGEGPSVEEWPKYLGEDPNNGEPISVRKGPYGFYVQAGETVPAEKGKKKLKDKPRRASLLKNMNPIDVELQTALRLLELPRLLGDHPTTGKPILAGIGRYGPYLKHGDGFVSLPAEDDVLTIGINRAVTVIAEAGEKGKGAASRRLGVHPEDGKVITQGKGRFGPYVKHGRTYASIPKDVEPESVTLDEALEMIAAKLARSGGAKTSGKKGGAKKSKTKKASAKKAGAKKAGAKKAGAKKSKAKKAAGRKPE